MSIQTRHVDCRNQTPIFFCLLGLAPHDQEIITHQNWGANDIVGDVEFTYQGIGKLISAGRLRVPANQREYAWEEEHVEALCRDVSEAMQEKKETYFLGTVVLTRTKDSHFQVVDGQQRLATVTMLIAVIRDMMLAIPEQRLAQGIEEKYLFGLDIRSEEDTPKLQLNSKDHEYYQNHILAAPHDERRRAKVDTSPHSNSRVRNAVVVLRRHFEKLVKSMAATARKDYLKDWLNYLNENANLIVLTVSDDVNAYVMFETLNDRGLRVSQADLVKNYLFGQSGSRLPEAQEKWASMIRSLQLVDKEDTAIDYLRLVSTLIHGLTRERQIFERIKEIANSSPKSITLLDTIEKFSADYVAMLIPQHFKWESYPDSIRRSVSTLNILGVTQIRHLMLAVAHHFTKKEADRSFRLFVVWIVRLFIAGSGRVGRVESLYAGLAHEIHTKTDIRTAEVLAERMVGTIPNDKDFEDAFARAYVSKSKLARYYLGALERASVGEQFADLIPNDDTKVVNLEHVIPVNPNEADFEEFGDTAGYTSRIGNLVLLNARTNSAVGNESFTAKRASLASSPFKLTKEVSEYPNWGVVEIDARQARLAKLAVAAWSMKIK